MRCDSNVQVGEQMKRMPGGSGNNPFAQLIEDAEGLDKIEALQVGSSSNSWTEAYLLAVGPSNQVYPMLKGSHMGCMLTSLTAGAWWSYRDGQLCSLLGPSPTVTLGCLLAAAGAPKRGPVREGCLHPGDIL